jgi:shikimate kinase
MGVGKTTVGRRLAVALNRPFKDADAEIEKAAGRTVKDIFDDFGEAAFRDGERKVIARLLDEPPMILALGGGAFVDIETRSAIKKAAISIWLQADLKTLVSRVSRRDTRPLLNGEDPSLVMKSLLESRIPAYSQADIHVDASAVTHQATVDNILRALDDHGGSD